MQSILVIDDQEEIRTTLEVILAKAGYHVVTIGNGQQAAGMLAKVKFDLVLTDVLMPGKDGIELVLELRKTQPELPVIVMTGGGQLPPSYYLKMARDMGAKGILQKPFGNEQLLMTVALALPPVK